MLAQYQSNGADFTHVNVLGSETQTTDYAGNGGQGILFYPWGQVWQNPSGGYPNSFYQIFASLQLYDTSTDGYVPPFRYYVPEQGRWLTPDPLAGDIANPQSLNRYAYVVNNPTSLVDPLGLGPQGIDCVAHPNKASCGGDAIGSGMDGSCYLDGIQTSCSVVLGSIASGFGVQCPGPCSGFTTGKYGVPIYVQYWAFAGAAGVANGYYPGLGPLNPDSLAIYMAMAYHSFVLQNHQEINGTVYEDTRAGIYGATVGMPGPVNGLKTGLPGTSPGYASDIGVWIATYAGDAWNPDDSVHSATGDQLFGWLSTSQGRVLRDYGPSTTCVLVGPNQGAYSQAFGTYYPSCN